MHPLLKRVAVNATCAAIILAIVGVVLTQLASFWLTSSPSTRAATGQPVDSVAENEALVSSLQMRIPITLALWGVVFVALTESVLYWVRSGRQNASIAQPPLPVPDAEPLLEELLRQAEENAAINHPPTPETPHQMEREEAETRH